MTGHDYTPPAPGPGDAAHAIVRAGLSAIPTAGGPLVEIFTAAIAPPLQRRRDEWMARVGNALATLESEKGIRLEDLQRNDSFIDTVVQASQAALRTSKSEKLAALRNAVLNSALPSAPEETLQRIFVTLVDDFTVWHLRILALFHEPGSNPRLNEFGHRQILAGGLSIVLEHAFPELKGNRMLYDRIWNDLFSRGLVNTDSLHGLLSGVGMLESRTTDLGKMFINFVMTSPTSTPDAA